MQIKIRLSSILLVGQLALVFLMLTSCQKDADTTMKVSDPIVDSVESEDGVMIHYEILGAGEPTLVFVHGWSCDRSYWKTQMDEFSKTYQVVSIDIGGHGESGLGRENWTMEAFGTDVASVVNKLNLNKIVMIGHSLGGGVVLQAAKQLPDRVVGLIGVDTYKKFGTGYPPEKITKIVSAFKADFVASMNGFIRSMFLDDADSTLVNQIVSDMSLAPVEVATSAMESYFSTDTQELLKKVRVPIRAINSDMTPTDIENNRKYASSFEMKSVTGIGHFIPQEDPTTFNRLLHETLDELTGKSGTYDNKK